MRIRVLDPITVARVAAGEVVERPASVVKELIENSIDAGASRIEVIIPGELTSLIAVVDDGSGIEFDDLPVAVMPHATSKLLHNDLSAISTLGFRGEALHAIAAVAHLRIVSRPAGADFAVEMSCSDGVASEPRPRVHPRGTRVEVWDLFARHPARLKFLKSKRSEMAAIRDAVNNAALAFPDIEFRLSAPGNDIVYRPTGDRISIDAICERARDVLGDAFRRDGVTVRGSRDGVDVAGLACVPTRTKKDANGIIVVVNGRPVQDRGIISAVRAAYAGLTAPGTVPMAFVSISMPPDCIDVNVHPRKTEIRFNDPRLVHDAVSSLIREALETAGLRTSYRLADMAASLARATPVDAGDRRRLPLGRVIGQANGSWILSETMDGIVIIDQHAAHERIILERLKTAIGSGASGSIELPQPVAVPLTPVELAALADRADQLAQTGLRLRFLPGIAMVEALPSAIGPVDAASLVADLAAAAVDDPAADVIGGKILDLLAAAGCRAAIKAGKVLSVEEADVLLREIEATPNASQCNHGRPVMVFLAGADIERLFARR